MATFFDDDGVQGLPPEESPQCWIPAAEAFWLRKTLKLAGIQSILMPVPAHGFMYVHVPEGLSRAKEELFYEGDEDGD